MREFDETRMPPNINTLEGWNAIDELQGKTFSKIEGMEVDSGEIIFYDPEGEAAYKMCHHQQCCEAVYLCEIDGDVDNLVGCEIIEAECVYSEYESDELLGYTFYKFRTKKGYLTLRWNGESNGYYSVGVDIVTL